MELKVFPINWVDYLEAVRKCLLKIEGFSIANTIPEKTARKIMGTLEPKIPKPDVIFAPVRGGLIPAVIASHWLGVKMYSMEPDELEKTIHPVFEDQKKPTALLFEDVSDSGYTFRKCVSYLEEYGYKVLTCSVVIKMETSFTPDIYEIIVSKDRYVLFPYESLNSELKNIKEKENNEKK